MDRFDAVIFDLDGTLLNTLDDLADAANRALESFGYPAHHVQAYRYFVGSGARALVQRSLPEGYRTDEVVDAVLERFRQEYSHNCQAKTRPYPGISDLLKALAWRGIPFGVNTNKPQRHAELTLAALLGEHTFAAIAGQREGVPLKPDPWGALELARTMGSNAARTLLVGDSCIDAQTARAAAMPSAGVTWGFRSEEELWEEGVRWVVHDPAEVLRIVGCGAAGSTDS